MIVKKIVLMSPDATPASRKSMASVASILLTNPAVAASNPSRVSGNRRPDSMRSSASMASSWSDSAILASSTSLASQWPARFSISVSRRVDLAGSCASKARRFCSASTWRV